jgi:tRNA threonylcarbamoyladenosine biosynthesis protein TsaB
LPHTLRPYLKECRAVNKRDGGILIQMNAPISELEKVLLIDACGETAGVAVCEGQTVIAKENLPRAGSVEIISAVERVMTRAGWRLRELNVIGVVNGPGSFTGVRVGLAAAKGLCEASAVRMIAVSRLQVLAEAIGLTTELLALDAGRGEFYLCEQMHDGATQEWLGSQDEVVLAGQGRRVVVTEEKTAEKLVAVKTVLHSLHVEDALIPVLRMLRSETMDMTLVDANYLRRESDIYKKPKGPLLAGADA